MIYKTLHFIPLIIFVWFPITFIITYIIAYYMHDINPLFPYISDTGTFSPESCVFGQLLNTGAVFRKWENEDLTPAFGTNNLTDVFCTFLVLIFMYIRYRQVELVCEIHHNGKWVRRCNRICIWLGAIAALGISIVANFQETNIFAIHILGAGLAFGLGCIYAILMSIISFRLYPNIGTKLANNIRVSIAAISGIANLICTITGGISFYFFKGTDITKWKLEDGGYYLHLVSVGTEWITANGIMLFIFSFYWEFKTITMYRPQIEVQENAMPRNDEPNIRY